MPTKFCRVTAPSNSASFAVCDASLTGMCKVLIINNGNTTNLVTNAASATEAATIFSQGTQYVQLGAAAEDISPIDLIPSQTWLRANDATGGHSVWFIITW